MISNMRHTRRRVSASLGAAGFTIVELLVVIAIIALLIGLLLPVISRVKQAGYKASTSAQLSTIASAIQQYEAEFQAFPGPLANNQVGYQFYGLASNPKPGVTDPLTGRYVELTYGPGSATQLNNRYQITGAENLVLGLLGGLELSINGANGSIQSFDYNPSNIFQGIGINYQSDIPAPKGAFALNTAKPRRWAPFLDVKPGMISRPDMAVNSGCFTDPAGRPAADSPIPEFIDQFPDGMPILYIRANTGGTAVLGTGGRDDNNNPLTDQTTNQTVTPQYDLAGVIQYTQSKIGTTANNPNRDHHGLQGLGDGTTGAYVSDTIDSAFAAYNGKNGLAYFKDPANPGTSNTHNGNARQKNGYILISPGPDRIYGTSDDIIYPGSLNP